ncbi:hypothetical protein [Aurantimonas sp. VKM B-3413]|uniref:hypothetical protein n=1 Tax=Aurantimonas sp. VKM B-3413 TaxID=2779401 RepID=UPI001E5FB705|nr:hypothetical protein [Aurantimonas sp. VKM B-3413]MCB8838672.1 hypothetical protein [Aurantimonas sp. VKM B-3413]
MTTELNTLTPPCDQMNAGALIGRPDLSDDVLLDALRVRLKTRRQSQQDAEAVLAAAMNADPAALDLMRTIPVPAPVAHLSMPTQRITGKPQRWSMLIPEIRVSWDRG